MAFPIPEKPPKEEEKKKEVLQTISKGVSKVSYYAHSFVDSLTLLIIAFLYFFFTGLALLFKRQLPKEWLAIAKDLNKGRVARKIKGMQLEDKPTIKKKFKIVDLETKKDLPFPTEDLPKT